MNCTHHDHKVLLISGFDPTGHAGILKDFSTCLHFGVEPLSFITALTAQSDTKFLGFAAPSPKINALTWKSFSPKDIAAVKIGMLGDLATTKFVIQNLQKLKRQNKFVKIVWDPVFQSSSKGALAAPAAIKLAQKELLPLVDVITPNAVEASVLLKEKFSAKTKGQDLALRLQETLPKHTALYLKGGHLQTVSKDWLITDTTRLEFSGKKHNIQLRGTGCLFASAVACGLSQHLDVAKACETAKRTVEEFFQLNA